MMIKKDLTKGILIGGGVVAVVGVVTLAIVGVGLFSTSQRSPISSPSLTKETGETSYTEEKKAASPTENQTTDTGEQTKQSTSKRLVVKDKALDIEVDNTPEAYREVEKIAASYQGYIAYSTTSTEDQTYSTFAQEQKIPLDLSPSSGQQRAASTGSKIATVVVKVPVEKLNQAEREMKKLGEVKFETESQEDVTQQHIDLKARLSNLQQQEQRYLQILAAAKTVDEMLKIEEQIGRIRGEIESLKGQIDFLEKSAALATLAVKIYEPPKTVRPVGRDWGFVKAITSAIQGFVNTINAVIFLAGYLLPLALIGVAIWLIIRYARERRTSK